jgi:hypothetical protein
MRDSSLANAKRILKSRQPDLQHLPAKQVCTGSVVVTICYRQHQNQCTCDVEAALAPRGSNCCIITVFARLLRLLRAGETIVASLCFGTSSDIDQQYEQLYSSTCQRIPTALMRSYYRCSLHKKPPVIGLHRGET